MQEFRKVRIQREIAELLSDSDPLPQVLPGSTNFRGRYIGVAFLFMILGVLMGQSIAMKAMETGSWETYQFAAKSYPEPQRVAHFDGRAFPELPEIEIIYVPNLAQTGKPVEVQI